jgi:hypothetical protein
MARMSMAISSSKTCRDVTSRRQGSAARRRGYSPTSLARASQSGGAVVIYGIAEQFTVEPSEDQVNEEHVVADRPALVESGVGEDAQHGLDQP